jgi:hypothetical protein
MVAAPSQLVADRGLACAGNAIDQIVSDTHFRTGRILRRAVSLSRVPQSQQWPRPPCSVRLRRGRVTASHPKRPSAIRPSRSIGPVERCSKRTSRSALGTGHDRIRPKGDSS